MCIRDRQTAVLYDRAALVNDIDSKFTVLNKWIKAQPSTENAKTPVSYTHLDVYKRQPTIRKACAAPNASAASSSASRITLVGWHRLSSGFIELTSTVMHC